MKLTVGEAAALLGSTDERVQDWIEDAELPAQKVRGQYRINRTDLLEWATEHRVGIAPQVFERNAPALADALHAGGVHRGGLRELVAALPLASDADRDTLLHVLLARGARGFAAVGEGIGIPQVRMPIIVAAKAPHPRFADPLPASRGEGILGPSPRVSGERVAEGRVRGAALLALSYLPEPLDSIDTVFLLVSPTVHVHLAMLAKLAYALKDDGFRAAIRRRAAAEEFLAIAATIEEGF